MHFFTSASFDEANFSSGARFAGSKFDEGAGFDRAHFKGRAEFFGISVDGHFSLAGTVFEAVPDFIQARFAEAPRLDNFILASGAKHALFWWPSQNAETGDIAARYRALRALAFRGHDHDNERLFLKGEFRARRHTVDKWWHAAFWLGIGYDVLSDFGGSIMRPAYAGLASVIAFAGLYYAAVFASCGPTLTEAWDQALYVSLKNAMLLINWDGADLPKAADCLFQAKNDSTRFALALATMQITQKVCSAGLLFLFLLAVRNRFKIK